MNTLYFACPSCRTYIDAGYRHAYWDLEDTGIVDRSSAVDISSILGAHDYWNVDADWLMDPLPAVRRFLEQHSKHHVRFGDIEDIPIPSIEDGLFDWLMEAGFVLEELPRYYVERLGFRSGMRLPSIFAVRSGDQAGGTTNRSEWRRNVNS
jgi:hypothetical protein